MKYSFVIPCYRSETTIGIVVDEINKAVRALALEDYEIILVNDGSPDNVWQVIQRLTKENDRIRGICLASNFGQHAALMAGYHYCTGDYIVCLDDDGQSPVDELGALIDKMAEGYDIVYAEYPEIKQTAFRRFGSWVNWKMAQVMVGQPKDVRISSFSIMKRFIMQEVIRYEGAYPYISGLQMRATKNITCVPVHQRARMQGKSGYTFGKLLSLWLNGFTAFSVRPLEVGTFAGAVVALAGFLYAAYIILRKLIFGNVIPGWSSVLSTMLILGGMILLMLGLIGEYIGRIYICINRAPQYVVRETTDPEPKADSSHE